jgi:hypothetical protein
MPPWTDSLGGKERRFTVSEVEEMASEMEACVESFMEWRQKHRV